MLQCRSVVKWLDQFPDAERPLAIMALEHLTFVTTDEVKLDLAVALSNRVTEAVARGSKIIIESILSKEDIERFLDNKGMAGQNADGPRAVPPGLFLGKYVNLSRSANTLGGWTPSENSTSIRKSRPTRGLYDEYFPSEIRDEQAGSEKYLDLVIRAEHKRLSRDCKAAKRRVPLSLGRTEIKSVLRSQQTIDLILITDNIGSGAQIIDFLSSILVSHALGALHGARVRITVLSWTATKQGLDAVSTWAKATKLNAASSKRSQISLDVVHLRTTESFYDVDDSKLLNEMRLLFKKYGHKGSGDGLGFGGTASRTVMLGSSCPNNLPDFFYRSSNEGTQYNALFESQMIPPDLSDYLIHERLHPSKRASYDPIFLADMKNGNLIQALSRRAFGEYPTWRVLLCSVAGYNRWAAIRALKISVEKFDQAEATLVHLGWIKPDFTPTTTGTSTARQFGLKGTHSDYASKLRFMSDLFDDPGLSYYPRSLRGVR